MRDSILVYINGEAHHIRGKHVFQPITDYLRYTLGKTGTKVVCAEGDCGACTILLGRLYKDDIHYKPINSCIQYAYQLDCSHVVTIEGLKIDNQLNPIQDAMMACHGAQCGYCTPGIVVAMHDYFNTKADESPTTEQDIRDALTGNLCRCTGYEPILKAGCQAIPTPAMKLPNLYPSKQMINDFKTHGTQRIEITWEDKRFFNPATLDEAIAFKTKHPETTIISGGTDISVFCNKRDFAPQMILSTSNLPGLDTIEQTEDHLIVGAKVSLATLEGTVKDIYPELAKILDVFGAPQIKHAGTLAGNIANGSPIADTTPFLFVMDAAIEFTGPKGARMVNMNHLYTGYKTMDAAPDELITRIHIPLPKPNDVLKLYKVSKRKNLDISTFTAAICMTQHNGNIDNIKIAYGGVGPTVLRLPKTEAFLLGKPCTLETFIQAGEHACHEITPLSDVRGSDTFRYQLARNILHKFALETLPSEQGANV